MSNQAHLKRQRASTPSRCKIAALVHRGYHDVLQGRGFPAEYDAWQAHEQRNYERGRQLVAALRGENLIVPKWARSARLHTILVNNIGLLVAQDVVAPIQALFFNKRKEA